MRRVDLEQNPLWPRPLRVIGELGGAERAALEEVAQDVFASFLHRIDERSERTSDRIAAAFAGFAFGMLLHGLHVLLLELPARQRTYAHMQKILERMGAAHGTAL